MALEVSIRDLPEGLPGAYTEFVEDAPPSVLIDREICYEEQEALEAEARCYVAQGPRSRRKFCYSPQSIHGMDPERIRALRRRIEQLRPDWVEQIKWACQIDNVDHKIISYSGVPPYPAYAILLNLRERGELPDAEHFGA
jgi:hypothetical protein